jgi:large subunit ribosomal protein L18
VRVKIANKMPDPLQRRLKRKKRISYKVRGTTERPRLAVFRSNTAIYGQLIDDRKGVTLVAVSNLSKDFKGKVKNTKEGAQALGEAIAKKAKAQSIESVVFDRGGYLYHGKVKAFADGARAGGLKF